MPATIGFPNNLGAAPVIQFGREHGGSLRAATNSVEVAAAQLNEADDRVMILALPSTAILMNLILFNDDLDSNGAPALTADIGLFYGDNVIGKNAGDPIDDDAIATAITTLQSANTAGVSVLFEALDIANGNKPLWEIGGLPQDPGGNIYIGISIANAAATAQAGTVRLTATYV